MPSRLLQLPAWSGGARGNTSPPCPHRPNRPAPRSGRRIRISLSSDDVIPLQHGVLQSPIGCALLHALPILWSQSSATREGHAVVPRYPLRLLKNQADCASKSIPFLHLFSQCFLTFVSKFVAISRAP